LFLHCWQLIKIYPAIFTIFNTSRKQIRRGHHVIFPVFSICPVAGLQGAEPEGFAPTAPGGCATVSRPRTSPDRRSQGLFYLPFWVRFR